MSSDLSLENSTIPNAIHFGNNFASKRKKKLDQLTRYHRVYAFLVALSPPITFLSGLFSLLVRYFWDGKMRSDRERYIDRQKEKVKYLSELSRSIPPPPFDLSTTTHTPSLTSDIKRSRWLVQCKIRSNFLIFPPVSWLERHLNSIPVHGGPTLRASSRPPFSNPCPTSVSNDAILPHESSPLPNITARHDRVFRGCKRFVDHSF